MSEFVSISFLVVGVKMASAAGSPYWEARILENQVSVQRIVLNVPSVARLGALCIVCDEAKAI